MAMDAGLAPADLRMRRRCARVMRAARPQLVRALIDEAHRPNRFAEPAEVFERRVDEGLDLLIRHIGGEAAFSALYAGQRLFEIVEPERERDANVQACRAAVEADWAALRHVLAPRLDADALALLERLYRDACGALGTPTKRHVRTLFIGDCLMPEIMSFLVGPLLDEGVSVDPFPLNFRDPRRMRAELDALAGPEPQLVVVSPFSHARLPEIEALLAAATSLAPRRRLQALVDAVIEQTRALLDALAARFECPVFVHNAALVPRARGAARAAAKALLTARARRYARERLNGWLVRHVAERNAASYAHLFVLDEDAQRRARPGAGGLSRHPRARPVRPGRVAAHRAVGRPERRQLRRRPHPHVPGAGGARCGHPGRRHPRSGRRRGGAAPAGPGDLDRRGGEGRPEARRRAGESHQPVESLRQPDHVRAGARVARVARRAHPRRAGRRQVRRHG